MKLASVLHERFGFTGNEIKVVAFLSVTLVLGLAVRWFQESPGTPGKPDATRFDYSRSDSEFVARSGNPTSPRTPVTGSKEETTAPPKKSLPQLSSINLNTASGAELQRLPGVGKETASRIIRYRDENGPFSSVDNVTAVRGIGPRKLERLRPYVKLH